MNILTTSINSALNESHIYDCFTLFFLILEETVNGVLYMAHTARQHALGPLSPYFNVQDILLENLQKVSITKHDNNIIILKVEFHGCFSICRFFSA